MAVHRQCLHRIVKTKGERAESGGIPRRNRVCGHVVCVARGITTDLEKGSANIQQAGAVKG